MPMFAAFAFATLLVPQKLSATKVNQLALKLNSLRKPASVQISNPIDLVKATLVLRGLTKPQVLQVFGQMLKADPIDSWVYVMGRAVFEPVSAKKGWPEIDWWHFAGEHSVPGFSSVSFSAGFPVQYGGLYLKGTPTPVMSFLKKTDPLFKLRTATVKMPNDPFVGFKLPGSAVGDHGQKVVRAVGAAQVVRMVDTVIDVHYDEVLDPNETMEYLEECHEEFLEAGGHWDAKKMMYVRKDGSVRKGT